MCTDEMEAAADGNLDCPLQIQGSRSRVRALSNSECDVQEDGNRSRVDVMVAILITLVILGRCLNYCLVVPDWDVAELRRQLAEAV